MYGEDMVEINQSKHTGCGGGSKIIYVTSRCIRSEGNKYKRVHKQEIL